MSYEVIIDLSDVEHRSFDFKRMFDERIPCKERIVRCGDCKLVNTKQCPIKRALMFDGVDESACVAPGGFCAWGELRGDA